MSSLAAAWAALMLERDQLRAKVQEHREILSAHVAHYHRNLREDLAREMDRRISRAMDVVEDLYDVGIREQVEHAIRTAG